MSAQVSLVSEIIVERHSECPITRAIAIIAGKWKPTNREHRRLADAMSQTGT